MYLEIPLYTWGMVLIAPYGTGEGSELKFGVIGLLEVCGHEVEFTIATKTNHVLQVKGLSWSIPIPIKDGVKTYGDLKRWLAKKAERENEVWGAVFQLLGPNGVISRLGVMETGWR